MHPISRRIVETYLHNFSALSFEKQRHFLYRVAIACPTEENRTAFITHSKQHTIEQSRQYRSIEKDILMLLEETQRRVQNTSPLKPSDVKRLSYWTTFPSFPLLYSALLTQFYLKTVQSSVSIAIPQSLISDVVTEILQKDTPLLVSSTYACCVMFFLYFFGYLDKVDEFSHQFQRVFDHHTYIDEAEYTNYYYGLTHLVICSSLFYQHAPLSQFHWTVEPLQYALKNLQKSLSKDLMTEIALALRMQHAAKREVEQYITTIEKEFDDLLGYVPRASQGATLENSEHLNVVLLLLSEGEAWIPSLQSRH
ncbi:MAG: hypothetical protein HZA34_03930 [Candidatus Pacebacteria bacterium]|nr:hypothetical protein [Candidatus Paceibacterota bacterium]